jgi:IS30 family transposase
MGTHYRQLSLEERCAISSLHAEGRSIGQIAACVDRSPSTISRELRRNTGTQVGYKPAYAEAQSRARRWRGSRLARQPALRALVLSRLAMGWSPEQLAGRLTLEHSSMRISHESIYRFIYAQIRRTKNYRWRHYLPRGKSRRGWHRRPPRPLAHIKDRVAIACRPAHVNSRRQSGHWEADLLLPRRSGAVVLGAEERKTRHVLLARQPGKHAQPIDDRLKSWFTALPPHLRRSLAQDNGPEFFEHHQLNPIGVKTYFCHPHSPWHRHPGLSCAPFASPIPAQGGGDFPPGGDGGEANFFHAARLGAEQERHADRGEEAVLGVEDRRGVGEDRGAAFAFVLRPAEPANAGEFAAEPLRIGDRFGREPFERPREVEVDLAFVEMGEQ